MRVYLSGAKCLRKSTGGEAFAGLFLKESGTKHWTVNGAGVTNSAGFTALPAGQISNGAFANLGTNAYFWAADGQESGLGLSAEGSQATWINNKAVDAGYSIRCIRE